MPSLNHEGVIALVRHRPAFAASLLREVLHVEVPHFTDARLTEAALPELVPIEYHADAVVLFSDAVDPNQPVFGTIFEVQIGRDRRKPFTWPVYAVVARARYECPFVVTVVAPDPAVARWAGRPIALGDGMIFRPRVIGPSGIPEVTDHDLALREPQLAVLSVMAHGGSDDVETAVSIARAAVHGVLALPPEQRVLYSALIEQALSEAARKAMDMDPQIEKFFSEAHRRSYDRGKAEGEAKGKAEGEAKGRAEAKVESLLLVLRGRGIAVTDDQQHHILACTDLATLDRWLERSGSAVSVDEIFT